ncbi:hypothetical protein [Sphaerisporangium sp. NPDC051011]|uniref:hypothetical protein n=1 Tax=Sphaerisporangium sp. NPDC051011 TaxID=3155792 RepID=UPI00340A8DE2
MYLLCDIDGVHIPFPGPTGRLPHGFHRHHVTPTGYEQPVTIWLNPATGHLICDLLTRHPLTPLWCTSWRADASTLIAPRLGLPAWDHIDLPRLPLTTSHPNGYLWKRDTIAEMFGRDEPLVWVDDDFTPADHAWAVRRTQDGARTVLIQPNPYRGLIRADLDALLNGDDPSERQRRAS